MPTVLKREGRVSYTILEPSGGNFYDDNKLFNNALIKLMTRRLLRMADCI